ncbi:MAG: MerR family transcriptional regulator [Bacillota bacterium]
MLRNCQKCYRVFSALHGNLCPACRQQAQTDFEAVRHYLEEQPAASIEEIHAATGVSGGQILEFLREGRLRSISVQMTCEVCHTPLAAGRICDACRDRLKPARPASGERVYIMETDKGLKPRNR